MSLPSIMLSSRTALFCCLTGGIALLPISRPQAASEFWKDWSISVRPELFHGADEDVAAAGGKLKLGYRHPEFLNDRWTRTMADYGFRSEITLATDSRANSEGSFAEIYGGLKHTFSQIAPTGQADAEPTPPDRAVSMAGATEQLDLPFVHLSGAVRFETDQTFENNQILYGPRLGIIHTRQDELSPWVLLPKMQVDFHGVDVLRSEDFESRGIQEDFFWRLGLEGDWRFEVGHWWASSNSFWHGFGLHTRVNYYRGIDMPDGAEQADLEDSLLVSAGVHYRIPASKVSIGPFALNFVYVTLTNGRKPPEERDQFGVRVGLAFSWNEDGF